MATAPDTLVVSGPTFQQGSAGDALITPTNGTQGKLADLLSGAAAVPKVLAQYTAPAAAAAGTPRAVEGDVAVSYAGSVTTGTVMGTRGLVTVAAATTITGSTFLYGSQGKITVNGSVTGGTMTAGMSQFDLSNAVTITGGANSIHWFDLGATSTKAAAGTIDGLRLTNTTATTMGQMINIYGKAQYGIGLHGIEAGADWFTNAGTADAAGNPGGWIKVTAQGADRYIPLATKVT